MVAGIAAAAAMPAAAMPEGEAEREDAGAGSEGGVVVPNTIEKLRCRLREVSAPPGRARRGLGVSLGPSADGKENSRSAAAHAGDEGACAGVAAADGCWATLLPAAEQPYEAKYRRAKEALMLTRKESAHLLHLNMELQLQARAQAEEIAHGRAQREQLAALEDQLHGHEWSLKKIRDENCALRIELEKQQVARENELLQVSEELEAVRRTVQLREKELSWLQDTAEANEAALVEAAAKLEAALSELAMRDAEARDHAEKRSAAAQLASLREAELQGKLAAVCETLAAKEAELSLSSSRAQQVV